MPVRLLLVDGLNLIRRVHAARGDGDEAARAEGAIVASLQSLKRALAESAPTHVACVFEGDPPTVRQRIHPDYKHGRTPMPEALRAALSRIQQAFLDAGVPSLTVTHEEADDVIATLAVKVAARGGDVIILSTDRGFHALVSERIMVRDHFAALDLRRADVVARYGVEPERLFDLWALAGLASSGVGGVPGIGPKTAARLIAAHGDLEGAIAAAAMLPGRVGAALREHAQLARWTRAFVALRQDVPLGTNLQALRRPLPE
jgi:protein Xni